MNKLSKDFSSEYRHYLKQLYFSQINKVKRLLGRTVLSEENMKYYTVESAERELIMGLIEFSQLKELPEPIIENDRYIYRETQSNRTTCGYYMVVINKKLYGKFPFKKDAIKKRNEVLIKIGKV